MTQITDNQARSILNIATELNGHGYFAYATLLQEAADQLTQQQNLLNDIEKLLLTEVGDFFSGFGHPGEPENATEASKQLMERITMIFSTQGRNYDHHTPYQQ